MRLTMLDILSEFREQRREQGFDGKPALPIGSSTGSVLMERALGHLMRKEQTTHRALSRGGGGHVGRLHIQ